MRYSFVLLSFLLIILIGCTGKNTTEENQDSIKLMELEQARLDSLRQDSIKGRNFTSPDLTYFQLHGDVNECVYQYTSTLIPPFDDLKYVYDEEGNLKNPPKWFVKEKKANKNFPESEYYYDPIYSHDGLILSCKTEEGSTGEYTIVYTNYIVDDYGNWVERTANIFEYDGGDAYNSFDKVEKREITYYTSQGKGIHKISNTQQQNDLLAQEIKRFNQSKNSQNDYDNNSNAASYQRNETSPREREILLELGRLANEQRARMPRIEQLYYRYQRVVSSGIFEPDAEFDLNDALDEIIKMKRKQVALAKELGDDELIREYEEKLNLFQRARDQMFYPDYGRLPSLY